MNPSDIIFKECFKLKNDESVLIITDKNKKEIAEKLNISALKVTSNVKIIEIPEAKVNGEEPSDNVADIMKKYDVVVAATSKSISHTKARVNACKSGARIATMPGITLDMFERTINVDYEKMKQLTLKLKFFIDKTNIVNIKTELGTELTLSLKNRISVSDYGELSKKCSFDNLPSGECFIAPLEESANGTFVVDACMGTGLLKNPVKIIFENGKAISFSGEEAEKVKSQFKGQSENAFTIAEFGIGTNSKAKITGKILEDEKVLGTCHIALGNNIGFGGTTDVPIHIDGVITNPTIKLDGFLIMDRGNILI